MRRDAEANNDRQDRQRHAPYRDLDEGKAAAAVLSMLLLVCIFKMDSGRMDLDFGGGGLYWIG